MANDHIYADGIAAVQLANGNLRIHLVQQGAEEGQTVSAGTLIVPAIRAKAVLGGLNQSVDRIIGELRKRREAGQAEAGDDDVEEKIAVNYDA